MKKTLILLLSTIFIASCTATSTSNPSPTSNSTPTSTPAPTILQSNCTITDTTNLVVYTKSRDLYATDGICKKQLTTNGTNFNPRLNSTGETIAFYSGSNILITDKNGKNIQQITPEEKKHTNLHWSPDGQKILYIEDGDIKYFDNTNKQYHSILERADLSEIATENDSFVPTVLWYPDSQKIALFAMLKSDLHDLGEGSPSFTAIYTYSLEGKKINTEKQPQGFALPIAWQGQEQPWFTTTGNGIGIFNLYRANLNGTNKKVVSGDTPDSAVYGSGALAISPDRKQLVTYRANVENTAVGLWLIDLVTKKESLILNKKLNIQELQWNTNSKKLVYSTYNGASQSLAYFDLSTNQITTIEPSTPIESGNFTSTRYFKFTTPAYTIQTYP
jgi:Tol biopolymer transport system component